MKSILRTFLTCFLAFLCQSSLVFGQSKSKCEVKEDTTVMYVWVVDVSGGTNIYLDEVQSAIDSFYAEATKYDNLQVVRYAGEVICDTTVTDGSFYDYSDQQAMLAAVDRIVSTTKNKVVRVYVLSDFINNTPLTGNSRLRSEALLTFRQHLETFKKKGMDLKLTMLILPPSSSPQGYSLDTIRASIPSDMYGQFPILSTDSLASFFRSEADSMNHQMKHVVDEPVFEPGRGTVISIICLFLVIAGAGVLYYINRRK